MEMERTETFSEVQRLKIVQAAKRSLRKPEGKKALDYLREERGFSDEVIDRFEFGYCPWNINHQLKGRLISPIYDVYGELVAVSTRHLSKEKGDPGYFWHERFDKGSYLYGLNWAKNSILKYKKVIIVEGEFDVAAMHSYGFTMTVGVCGSTFTLSQASLLARYCQEVYVMFDNDSGGRSGLKRTMKLAKDYYFNCYGITYAPVNLPLGKDPDKILKVDGAIGMKNILVKAKEEVKIWS
jgi:DNA primase